MIAYAEPGTRVRHHLYHPMKYSDPMHCSPRKIRSELFALLLVAQIFVLPAVAAAMSYPPGPRPDRVVLTWTGDPASSQAVTWRTEANSTEAWAEILPATDGPLAGSPVRVSARSASLEPVGAPSSRYHSVGFTGLAADTLYAYRVGGGSTWSEWFQFRTARREVAPFTFLFFGDPQTDIRSQWSRVWRQGWLTAPQAAFAVLTGDLINKGDSDDEWGEWFEAVGWVGATRPLVLAAGSHEYASSETAADGMKKKSLSPHWRPQFSLPRNGPDGLAETCYWFDYQGTRFVVLNALEQQAEQAAWLRQVLSNPRPRWTVLAFHDPIFSGGRNRDNQKYRALWKPVIDELKVDLVLSGHDHVYARSGHDSVPTGYPSDREVVNGTVYVVAVSGPKMYELTAKSWAVRTAANTQTFQTITIDGDELRYTARTATGRPLDAFTLRKRDGARNELIECFPPGKP